jgi:hypothetical protein
MRAALHIAAFALFALAASASCSLSNREGPEVTCADLECGRVNACEEGIIAQCVDGVTVRYHACATAEICEATWQVPGAYKCSYELTDCEGCRPERKLGCGEGGFPEYASGGGGDGGGTAGGGVGGSAGGGG